MDAARVKELITGEDLAALRQTADEYMNVYESITDSSDMQSQQAQVCKLLILVFNRMSQLQQSSGGPDLAQTLSNLGHVWMNMGEADKAVIQLTKALSLKPDDSVANDRLAKAYVTTGNYDKAIEHQEKAIVNASNKILANAHLAAIYEAKGAFDEATSTLINLTGDIKDDTSREAAEVFGQLGALKEKLGEYKEAVEYLQKAHKALVATKGEDNEKSQEVAYLIEMAQAYCE